MLKQNSDKSQQKTYTIIKQNSDGSHILEKRGRDKSQQTFVMKNKEKSQHKYTRNERKQVVQMTLKNKHALNNNAQSQ